MCNPSLFLKVVWTLRATTSSTRMVQGTVLKLPPLTGSRGSGRNSLIISRSPPDASLRETVGDGDNGRAGARLRGPGARTVGGTRPVPSNISHDDLYDPNRRPKRPRPTTGATRPDLRAWPPKAAKLCGGPPKNRFAFFMPRHITQVTILNVPTKLITILSGKVLLAQGLFAAALG